ncbi:MAG: DDE transposase, partial [Asticcacaulis sp. 32-58-5]
MPRKSILTAKERAGLLSHPTDEPLLIEHWTLHPEDLILVNTRRKAETRFALALQLCSLRYPGRLIAAGDTIPAEAVQFLAEQLATRPDVLLDACKRAATRSEHLDLAAATATFVLSTGVHGSLTDLAIGALDALVSDKPVHGRQHQISWLREPPGPQGSRAMIAIIQRLDLIREIDITPKTSELIGMERRINLAAEGKRLTAQNYRQMNAPRRYTTLAATVFELGLDLTDQAINMFEALIARSVRRAHRRREERAQEEALNSQDAMAFLRDLAVVLVDAHDTGRPLDPAITTFTT